MTDTKKPQILKPYIIDKNGNRYYTGCVPEDGSVRYESEPKKQVSIGKRTRTIATVAGIGLATLALGAYLALKKDWAIQRDETIDACNTTFKVEYAGNLDDGTAYVRAINDDAGEIGEAYFVRQDGTWGINTQKTLDANIAAWKEKYQNEGGWKLAARLAQAGARVESYQDCFDEISDKLVQK